MKEICKLQSFKPTMIMCNIYGVFLWSSLLVLGKIWEIFKNNFNAKFLSTVATLFNLLSNIQHAVNFLNILVYPFCLQQHTARSWHFRSLKVFVWLLLVIIGVISWDSLVSDDIMTISNKQERMWKEPVMLQLPSFSVCETVFDLI